MTADFFIRVGVFFNLKPMWVYLRLQFAILNRKITDFGIPPIVAYPLFIATFILLCETLYAKTNFANYLILLVALSLVSKLSQPKRNGFLKSIFNKKVFMCVRIIENIICCLPFTIFLAYKNQLLFVAVLNLLVLLIALLKFNVNVNFTIPTPFEKKPFEFTIGFRNTFYIFPLAYFLTYTSISVDNFNLGVFSLLLVCITCFSFYSKVENIFFVWSFNLTPSMFLIEKTKTCLMYFTLLGLPIVLALSSSFFSRIDVLFGAFLLCYAYLTAVIFAKYAAFPNKISMQQGILIALSIIFPYLILIIIPFLYSLAIKKLTPILNDHS